MISFGPVAEFYDELMDNVPYQTWAQYYRSLLASQGIQPNSILDACCGTGNLTEIFASDGRDMTGIDLSENMIKQAIYKRSRKKINIDYHVANVTNFELNKSFDAAYSFFDSLNYILSPIKLKNAFECVARHLKPGGSFIFDMNTEYAYRMKMFDQQDMSQGKRLRYNWISNYDVEAKTVTVHMTFWYKKRVFTEDHVQKAYPIEHVKDFLSSTGFKDIDVYESYTLNPPHKKCDRVHFVARLG